MFRGICITLRDLSVSHSIYKLTLDSLKIRLLKVCQFYLQVLLNSNKEQHLCLITTNLKQVAGRGGSCL